MIRITHLVNLTSRGEPTDVYQLGYDTERPAWGLVYIGRLTQMCYSATDVTFNRVREDAETREYFYFDVGNDLKAPYADVLAAMSRLEL